MSERIDLPPVTEGITYDPESGVLLSYDKSVLKYDVFRLPEGVKSIPENFFKEKLFATKLILPSTLKVVSSGAFESTLIEEIEFLDGEGEGHGLKIGYFAFERINNLRRVRLPKHVYGIFGHAFADCPSLKELVFPTRLTYLTDISGWAFSGCALEELVLPSGIRYLEDGVFAENRRLKTVRLPKTLKRIDKFCFRSARLARVIYEGTREEYDRVLKAGPSRSFTNHYDNSRVGHDWVEEGPMVNGWVDHEDFELVFET